MVIVDDNKLPFLGMVIEKDCSKLETIVSTENPLTPGYYYITKVTYE